MSTKIEWVLNPDGTQGKTWNPITGCSKISRGCKYCYAERIAKRLAGRHGYPKNDPFKVTTHPERLHQPVGWKKPLMIFLCSMSDFFHPKISDGFIFQILEIIRECPHHTFQILTKRSNRVLQISREIGKWPTNIWLGVTVESKEYKKRTDHLRQIGASVKFISCEPLLEDLGKINLDGIDWVIVGGESGPKPRPMNAKWVINIRDQCIARKVPYFFKQWGGPDKNSAGRKLEGKEWNQMPRISRTPSDLQMKLGI